MEKLITLDEFIIEGQKHTPGATGELSKLLRDIGVASKIINRDLSKAGLVENILGETGSTNVQGEEVKKLDEFANDILIKYLKAGGECCGIASEEEDTFVSFHDEPQCAAVCPVDCCVPDDNHVESEETLLNRQSFLHNE